MNPITDEIRKHLEDRGQLKKYYWNSDNHQLYLYAYNDEEAIRKIKESNEISYPPNNDEEFKYKRCYYQLYPLQFELVDHQLHHLVKSSNYASNQHDWSQGPPWGWSGHIGS